MNFFRNLDTSPGKSFYDSNNSESNNYGVVGSSGQGGAPKLSELDIALGLGGPDTGTKKVGNIFFVNFSCIYRCYSILCVIFLFVGCLHIYKHVYILF